MIRGIAGPGKRGAGPLPCAQARPVLSTVAVDKLVEKMGAGVLRARVVWYFVILSIAWPALGFLIKTVRCAFLPWCLARIGPDRPQAYRLLCISHGAQAAAGCRAASLRRHFHEHGQRLFVQAHP